MTDLSVLAAAAKAWPFEQARLVEARVKKHGFSGGAVIFETGYGPSGLPHIGTFGEVVRTMMVKHAFEVLTENAYPTRLICFSDDMDGFRKVPTNLPNQEMLAEHLGKPLTAVPDPFGEYEGFAQHNNARLMAFLDSFGFEYEFLSSTEQYTSGVFDETLLTMLERFDQVMEIMLPTLGPERRETYSPFLPVSPKSGKVLQVPTLERDVKKGTIVFEDEDGSKTEVPVTGGCVKVQWKPDWALRWTALGVDYEMAGKDLIDSIKVSSKICRVLGGQPPEGFNYELFLDEKGEKISKSKGNGIAVEDWLKYATPESLSLFNFQKPKTAKKLYFDVIPKAVDEYLQHLAAYEKQNAAEQLENPVWHIHSGEPPQHDVPISFALMLNLASAASAHDKTALWGFISRYVEGATPENHPLIDKLAGYAVAYYEDFVLPQKQFRSPSEKERAAMADLRGRLAALDPETRDGEAIQAEVYAVGKEHEFEPLRDWFKALYEVLLGQTQGPRFGSFAAIYGLPETIALIDKALSGELAAAE
ncbi:MAG: lysine--tRNA ligase [Maricaulaceae bacterium]|jgi:lysyl-tRNA synthetase class 1